MQRRKTRGTAMTGLMLALAIALAYLESLIPSVGIPGVKIGLSNTVTMYCLFFLGPLPALAVTVLKSGFVLLTRGLVAGTLSLAGGVSSMVLMMLLNRWKPSYGLISVVGAVVHNMAQLLVARWIVGTFYILYFLPVLTISGIVMGILTALVLKLVMPALEKAGVGYFKKDGSQGK